MSANDAGEARVVVGSGNVYADLNFEYPEEELAKAKLVSIISRVISDSKLTQVKVAELTGLDQPSVSKLLRGRTGGFSLERLIALLNSLGQDVEIKVQPADGSNGRTTIAPAS
jgi:predicted XRE-type DNA-binding protein